MITQLHIRKNTDGGERVARGLRIRRVRVEKRNRISGVDHNTAVPAGQTAERSFEIDPAQGYQDDIGACRFLNGI